jgi:hypothetical protein
MEENNSIIPETIAILLWLLSGIAIILMVFFNA